MSPDAVFQIANLVAMAGWVLLVLSPAAPRYLLPIAGFVLPTILSLGYFALILAFWSSAEGAFDSLASVMLLFDSPGVALAGWVHFLAFDLFIGGWMARDARTHGVPHLAILPCLALTFLFGPIGFVLYLALRAVLSLLTQRRSVP